MRHRHAGHRPTFLALGDSITDGGHAERSYRFHLHRLLTRAGHVDVRWSGSMRGVFDHASGSRANASHGLLVHGRPEWPPSAQGHEGHWGWTSLDVLRGHKRQRQRGKLSVWLGSTPRPDVVLLHLGTNDLTKLVARDGEPVRETARRIEEIVGQLCVASPRVRVVVASPIPYCRFRSNRVDPTAPAKLQLRRKREATLAQLLRDMVANPTDLAASCRRRARLAYVNMSASVGCEHLFKDGVHPAAAGAERMAAAWFAALEPLVLPMPPHGWAAVNE